MYQGTETNAYKAYEPQPIFTPRERDELDQQGKLGYTLTAATAAA